RSIAKSFVPLCVVATAGTTEEGAVDQLDKLLDLRLKLEREHNASFWIHIDAAWGGFFRSLFNMAAEDRATAAILRTSTSFGIPFCADAAEWHLEVLSPFVKELFKNGISTGAAAKEAEQHESAETATVVSTDALSTVPALKEDDQHESAEVAPVLSTEGASPNQSGATQDTSEGAPRGKLTAAMAGNEETGRNREEPLSEAQILERLEQKTIRDLTAMERAIKDQEWDAYVRQLLELPQRLASRLQNFPKKP